ncbi:nuclear transport factor 2 family protein [Saccharomonospora sp. NPDC046836]|uniref:nuclear transport factor 2 family protein n=1 Tax=Saccharomonospora sp. NPDC046836 TaxID=3156921 RepID=UPI0033F8D739
MCTDHEDIRNLCFRYTYAVDDGDFAAIGALLAGGELVPAMPGVAAEPIVGAEAISAFYANQVVTYENGDPRTRHLITNQLIEIDEDRTSATSRCYFTVLQRAPGEEYQIVVGGRYDDEFVRAGGAWRFARKTIRVDHLNRVGLHFRIAESNQA